jgi:hypothetical protein
VARGSVAKTAYFPETISCLAGIPGESWNSGRELGLHARANQGTLSSYQEGSHGQYTGRDDRSENRADNGRFHWQFGPRRRRVWERALNVGSSGFHEGRGAGKTDPLGGRDLVNRKNCFRKKEKLQEKDVLLSTRIKACSTGSCRGRLTIGSSCPALKHVQCS